MKRQLCTLGAAACILALASCGSEPDSSSHASQNTPTEPASPSIDTVGQLVGLREYGDRVVYQLDDGRVEREKGYFRVAYDLTAGDTLVVAGSDGLGAFVALIGRPDGAPTGCEHVMRYGGREWGSAIESQGILWQKAPAFKADVPIPRVGEQYPASALLCLNDQARVVSVRLLPLLPPQPEGSASAR